MRCSVWHFQPHDQKAIPPGNDRMLLVPREILIGRRITNNREQHPFAGCGANGAFEEDNSTMMRKPKERDSLTRRCRATSREVNPAAHVGFSARSLTAGIGENNPVGFINDGPVRGHGEGVTILVRMIVGPFGHWFQISGWDLRDESWI